MREQSKIFCVKEMAKVLGVSRSGYYDYLGRSASTQSVKKELLREKIYRIFKDSHKIYGSPRVHAELVAQGFVCSRPRVARIMRVEALQAKMYKKFHKTTRPAQNPYYRGQDLVKQNFFALHPNQVWVTDITYIKAQMGLSCSDS